MCWMSPVVGHKPIMKTKHPSNMSGAFPSVSWCVHLERSKITRELWREKHRHLKWILLKAFQFHISSKNVSKPIYPKFLERGFSLTNQVIWNMTTPTRHLTWPHIVPGWLPIAAPFSQARPSHESCRWNEPKAQTLSTPLFNKHEEIRNYICFFLDVSTEDHEEVGVYTSMKFVFDPSGW